MLVNLNDSEVKFVIFAVQEMSAKILAKLATKPAEVRLTKSGVPAKKPGRKPGRKSVVSLKQAA